jgi:hypothetical protein
MSVMGVFWVSVLLGLYNLDIHEGDFGYEYFLHPLKESRIQVYNFRDPCSAPLSLSWNRPTKSKQTG